MNRCTLFHLLCEPAQPRGRSAAVTALLCCAIAAAAAMLAAPPAHAQLNAPMALAQQPRSFPPTALFGKLEVLDADRARINGQPVRIAPGMRMHSPLNHMVPYLQTRGQKLAVRYQIEPSTGYLHRVWLLRESEMPPRRWLGLLGPKPQDPDAVQPGALGVGLAEQGDAPAVRPPATGQAPLQGRSTISGLDVTPR
ncbi:hypothetical protein [Lampropedia cohaerens]|uniref:hypothetical protein n=1 Tax=Lampropedia cohaerens TaxID=1610491 RepID=UPI00069ACF27|nr:hypothetical protein [Lampropedia cohaerens]